MKSSASVYRKLKNSSNGMKKRIDYRSKLRKMLMIMDLASTQMRLRNKLTRYKVIRRLIKRAHKKRIRIQNKNQFHSWRKKLMNQQVNRFKSMIAIHLNQCILTKASNLRGEI